MCWEKLYNDQLRYPSSPLSPPPPTMPFKHSIIQSSTDYQFPTSCLYMPFILHHCFACLHNSTYKTSMTFVTMRYHGGWCIYSLSLLGRNPIIAFLVVYDLALNDAILHLQMLGKHRFDGRGKLRTVVNQDVINLD